MSKLELIRALYDYNEWANNHVLDAASHLSDGEFARPLGASFGSVQDNLVHTIAAQIVWLKRWTGEKSEAMALLADGPSLATVRRACEISQHDLRAFVDSLREGDLGRAVSYRDGAGETREGQLWQMMLQIANHGTHHRAETAMAMAIAGKPMRELDYLFFQQERAEPG